jgi:hypothetical protein
MEENGVGGLKAGYTSQLSAPPSILSHHARPALGVEEMGAVGHHHSTRFNLKIMGRKGKQASDASNG